MNTLVEVSQKTFEKLVDCYQSELYIRSQNVADGRLLSFIDYPRNYKENDNPEQYIVAQELLDNAGIGIQYNVRQDLL